MFSISLIFPFIQNNFDISYEENRDVDFVKTSAQRSVTTEWLTNNEFLTQDDWEWENGTDGDNSDMNAIISSGQANYEVLGETRTFTVVYGIIDSPTSPNWIQFQNGDFQYPDTAEIRSYGAYVSHIWADDNNQAPSVHWKTNISVPIDMSDYVITSATLEVIVNASVSSNVDTPNDDGSWTNFAIGDSVTYYSQISDLDYNPPVYTVASNKTKYLGQQNSSQSTILTLDDSPLETVAEIDLITALNSAFDKDPSHSNFTLTLGIDIYSEDNLPSTDTDTFSDLIIKTCNLTFTVKKKIDQSTSLSWNQEGNRLDSANIQVTDAKFFFKYKVNNTWPISAPLSEIIFYINDKAYNEGIIRLSSANESWKEAKVGGFDVTSLISTVGNITVSIEVFLKDTFELGQVYSISIDDVYLNISYIETFPDYGTDLELFLDGEDKTLDPVIQIPIDHMLNVIVTYKDNVSANHISADSAILEGKVSGDFNESIPLEQYSFTVNSSVLGLGISVLTITVQKVNYKTQSIQIFVEVIERETQLMLNIGGSPKNDSVTIFSQFDKFLDITINYNDNLTLAHIDGASVDLLGIGSMDEDVNQYNFTLNTNNLTLGVNVITIFAQKSNYQSQTIQFFINIQIRATYIEVRIEEEKYDGEIYNTQFDEALNVTVLYRDNETDTHLMGASVELLGVLGTFDENGNQFNYTLKTNDLEKDLNILTIFAQLDGYQPQTVQLFINVANRATDLILLVNGTLIDPINQTDPLEFEANELVNITAFYKDNRTQTHLIGASVELLGFNNLNRTGVQFNITINTNELDPGLNILTVFAQLTNYQPESTQFVIKVTDRATIMQLSLNGDDKTDDPVLEVAIGSMINITLKFFDYRTGLEIPNAWLQLRGESLSENLTEIGNQYYIILDSTNLLFGDNKYTIIAQAPTYQINTTIKIIITVNPISTSIDTVSDTNLINPGEDFLIQINLTNINFGGSIKNATVTYSWVKGQGTLTDSNDDGIYETSLNNIPAGTYHIRINAYAGENYDFSDDFEIFLNVVAPPGPDITIILISLAAGVVGLTTAFVLYQKHFKYPQKVRMLRKIRKKIGKGKKLKPLTVSTRDNIITGEIERNREVLKVEKEIVDKINKKSGGETIE